MCALTFVVYLLNSVHRAQDGVHFLWRLNTFKSYVQCRGIRDSLRLLPPVKYLTTQYLTMSRFAFTQTMDRHLRHNCENTSLLYFIKKEIKDNKDDSLSTIDSDFVTRYHVPPKAVK
jgi:hypothetical protein